MDRELIKLIEENGLTLHGDIEFFAHLVAEREREACAEVCEMQMNAVVARHPARIEFDPDNIMAKKCAAAIRNRGTA